MIHDSAEKKEGEMSRKKKIKFVAIFSVILLLGGCGKATILNGVVFGSASGNGENLLNHLETQLSLEPGKVKISIKEVFGLSDGCVILGVGRQTPHKEAVIEMLYYEFMGEGHSH